jgi:centromere/kinetochore protein ZW10
LFVDLEKIVLYITNHFPAEITEELSKLVIPNLTQQIKVVWLSSSIPTSLDDMLEFQKVIALVQEFGEILDQNGWDGSNSFEEWIANVPKLWLTKRRETCLEWMRGELASGVGITKTVEHSETQTLSREEGKHMGTNGQNDDWDAAWSDTDEVEVPQEPSSQTSVQRGVQHDGGDGDAETSNGNSETDPVVEEDDMEDAWGWGDGDDVMEDPVADEDPLPPMEVASPASPARTRSHPNQREVTLTERYLVSQMPERVLHNIKHIIGDSATLSQPHSEKNPVTSAAVGLFAMPTLVLAMYRAVSPYYYAKIPAGNMCVYGFRIDNLAANFSQVSLQRCHVASRTTARA